MSFSSIEIFNLIQFILFLATLGLDFNLGLVQWIYIIFDKFLKVRWLYICVGPQLKCVQITDFFFFKKKNLGKSK